MSLSSLTAESPLVLVGAGKMGAAMLKGWLDHGVDREAIVVVDPDPPADSAAFIAAAGVRDVPKPPVSVTARAIVLAVKPQIIADVMPGLNDLIGKDTVTLSIAAGTTLANLEAGLGRSAIVRSIPNTPAQIRRGITVAVANRRVSRADKELVGDLLEAVGEVVWVKDEGMIDAATAVSGSGPAYVYLLAESLAEAAIAEGFSPKVAEQLARATVAGAGELLRQSSHPAAELRRHVTSPGGTTAAALDKLMSKQGMTSLMKKAVAAARKRSTELSH